ncbi:MAG: ABC transporter ATP-binding protein [Coriobacteriia bacterium]|nr:ABC transporter ATP-binding protein [Coriobacteriia bacterium]
MPYKLELNGITLTYTSTAGSVTALADLDLQLKAGEPVALIGPSGSGKTTSLLLAAGLIKPTRGEVIIDGEPILEPRSQTALILQDYGLLPWKSVYENAALGLQIRRVDRLDRRRLTEEALTKVGLLPYAGMYPDELSGGMRQRVALARVLTLDADLLLMDEPLSSLDALLRETMQDMLLDLWKERCYSQLLVTHSIEEAAYLGARIIVMDESPGRIRAEIANPQMGGHDYRSDPAFFETCQQIRETLAEGSSTRVDKTMPAGDEMNADHA